MRAGVRTDVLLHGGRSRLALRVVGLTTHTTPCTTPYLLHLCAPTLAFPPPSQCEDLPGDNTTVAGRTCTCQQPAHPDYKTEWSDDWGCQLSECLRFGGRQRLPQQQSSSPISHNILSSSTLHHTKEHLRMPGTLCQLCRLFVASVACFWQTCSCCPAVPDARRGLFPPHCKVSLDCSHVNVHRSPTPSPVCSLTVAPTLGRR